MSEILFGVHAVHEILKTRPNDVFEVAVMKERTSKNIEPILDLCKRNRIPISYLNDSQRRGWLRKIPKESEPLHQSIFADVKERIYPPLSQVVEKIENEGLGNIEAGFILVLDEIMDPHNLGALVRSAVCSKVDAVVIPKHGSAQVTATVVKVSAGGTERLSICRAPNISQALDFLKKRGFFVIGLSADASISIFETDCSQRTVLVIGNEERGLKKGVASQCDTLARIPMSGALDSLNASVAGGIAMFEVVRQRKRYNSSLHLSKQQRSCDPDSHTDQRR
jgi:23S rRNA (guanosine2251-2'-O)-methyltransferase